MAVRAALIAADAVGSAVIRIDGDAGEQASERIERWVRECFAERLTDVDVWGKVVKPRIEDLRARGRWADTKGSSFRDESGFKQFQCEVPTLGPRALLSTSCGSGKTLAAWNWITAQLEREEASRVIFLYPTRATATEGFRDYVSWAPEDDAGLLSGTASYELKGMFETPADEGDPRKGRTYQSDDRLFALGHWKKRIFSATADQFFPFMQYAYGPLCLLPLLVDSILVVDEVHSFDSSMFATLRSFLTEFPEIPVLCMTATLPESRRKVLVNDCNLVPYPKTPPPDLVADSAYKRYHVEWIDPEGAKSLVVGELKAKRRVLWVSNRVADCQAAFETVEDENNDENFPDAIKASCYHSRFKLEDRKQQHKKLIGAFQDAARQGDACRGVLGATTQVCEMSLDLDAEVLVTELAPIASLIQRMGRCNRDSERMRGRPIGRVYVIRPVPGKEKPYEPADLDAARKFIDSLAGRDTSQDDLENAYAESERDTNKFEFTRLCPFLDSGPYAESKVETFRDIEEFTVPCVLDYDLKNVSDILKQRNSADRVIDGFIVPVPRRWANEKKPENANFPSWLSVAQGLAYDKKIGFDDRKLNKEQDPKS